MNKHHGSVIVNEIQECFTVINRSRFNSTELNMTTLANGEWFLLIIGSTIVKLNPGMRPGYLFILALIVEIVSSITFSAFAILHMSKNTSSTSILHVRVYQANSQRSKHWLYLRQIYSIAFPQVLWFIPNINHSM